MTLTTLLLLLYLDVWLLAFCVVRIALAWRYAERLDRLYTRQ